MSPPTPPLSTSLSTTPTPILLDGALATHLESLGASISTSLWSASALLTQPSLILQTHLDYFRAGARIAITASYQASLPGLIQGLGISDDEASALVRKSVELAQDARKMYLSSHPDSPAPLRIAGSVGPYGAYLADGSEYRGDYTLSPSAMKSFHRGRISALVAAGIDVLACETMPSQSEVSALLELLTQEFPSTEAWFSFTLLDATHIADGTPISVMAELFQGVQQVVALGFNCIPAELALPALRELGRWTDKPLIVYANSGETWDAGRREWEGVRAEGEGLREMTREWVGAGARLVGGCCRTGPGDIGVMRKVLGGVEGREGKE